MSNPYLIIILTLSLIILAGAFYVINIRLNLQKDISSLAIKLLEVEQSSKVFNDFANNVADSEVTYNGANEEHSKPSNNDIIEHNNASESKLISEENRFSEVIDSMDSPNSQNMDNPHEMNIISAKNTTGTLPTAVDPNNLSLESPNQIYNLDIIIEKTPINKAIRDDSAERER